MGKEVPRFWRPSQLVIAPLPEFMQLSPNDVRNGAPIAFMESIYGSEEEIPSLCSVSQGANILL
jgi:hypothetical protein